MPVFSLILLACAWALYFALHSILASNSFKEQVKQWSTGVYHWYRLGYSFIAGAGFLAVMLFAAFIPSENVFAPFGWMRYAGLIVAAWGVIVCRLAFRHYSLGTFLGTSDKQDEDESLVTTGILSRVRHPLYSGLILISLGYWIYLPSWTNLVTVACWWLYLPVGIWLEEKKLIARFGQEYIEYKKRVPALAPSLLKLFKKD